MCYINKFILIQCFNHIIPSWVMSTNLSLHIHKTEFYPRIYLQFSSQTFHCSVVWRDTFYREKMPRNQPLEYATYLTLPSVKL